MEMSTSTTNNRIGDSRPSKNFTPLDGMPETGSSETHLSQQIQHLLRAPGHVYAHGNVVLDWHCQKRGRIDLEIGERSRNDPGDMGLTALLFHFERNFFVLDGLSGELNLQICIDG